MAKKPAAKKAAKKTAKKVAKKPARKPTSTQAKKPARKMPNRKPAGQPAEVAFDLAVGSMSRQPVVSLVLQNPPPGAGAAIAAEMAYHGPRIAEHLRNYPPPSWIRWCPQTFPDGCGMNRSGFPLASLAALNPSPLDCQLVASEMRYREHANEQAASELEAWSAAPSQFFRKRSNQATAQLRHEIEATVMEAANPDFFNLCRSADDARQLYDKFVAAGMAGFELALKRYAHELRHVPELRERFKELKRQRKQTSQRLNESKLAKRRKYGSRVMTVAQRNAAIVTELSLLRESIGNEAARLAVAEKYGLSDRQVANIWRQNRPEKPHETS